MSTTPVIPTPADIAPTPVPPSEPDSATPNAASEQPLGEGGKKALQAERDARATAERALADLRREVEDSQKTAEQKAADDLAEARRSAESATAQALRYEVAAEKGLDIKLASRLTGATREELEADADVLMTLIPTQTKPPVYDPQAPVVPSEKSTANTDPGQVTQSDLDALEAAGNYTEINRLRREGLLDHILKG